ARNVVIVRVLQAPDNAARLIFPASYRLKLHFHKSIFDIRVVLETNRESCLARLLQNVWSAWSGIVFVNRPFRRAATGLRRRPAGRRRAGLHVVKVDRLSDGSSCRDCHRDYRYTHLFHRFLTWLIPFLTWAS